MTEMEERLYRGKLTDHGNNRVRQGEELIETSQLIARIGHDWKRGPNIDIPSRPQSSLPERVDGQHGLMLILEGKTGVNLQSSRRIFFRTNWAEKRRAKMKTRDNTEKIIAVIKSLYAILSPFTKLGVTPGGGGDAGIKPPSAEFMLTRF